MNDRERAFMFLAMATDYDAGRRQRDPLFEAVTEHRQREGYSACGDLAHWLYFRMGFRFDWVNRQEHQGWRMGRNLALLTAGCAGGLNRYAKRPERGMKVDAGDVLVVYAHQPKRSHVAVVMEPGELDAGTSLRTAEYGQFDATYGRASGKAFRRPVSANATRILLGSSPVDSVLSLDGLAAKDDEHVAPDDPTTYFEALAAKLRVLRLTDPRLYGSDVWWLCEELKAAGYDPGRPLDVFGPCAEKAVRAWQEQVGLTAEGVGNGKVETDEWCVLLGWTESEAHASWQLGTFGHQARVGVGG